MTDDDMKKSEDIPGSSFPSEEQAGIAATVSKPGAQLAEYRQNAGLSIEQVASRLKMTARQVQNLEADNYSALHGIAISRGFVRAYAKLLQVDPDPLVALFPSDKAAIPVSTAKKRVTPEPFAANRQPFKSRRGVSGKMIGLLIVILLVVSAIVAQKVGWLPVNFSLIQKSAKEKEIPEKVTSPREALPKDAPKEKVTSSASVSTEIVTPKATVISDEPLPADTTQREALPENPAPVAPAAPSAAEKAESAPISMLEQAKNTLVLSVRGNSWIQIQRSGDSAFIFKRLVTAGETETFEIKEPVDVTIGYAPLVDATFRGKPLILKTVENSTVARLKLK